MRAWTMGREIHIMDKHVTTGVGEKEFQETRI